MKHNLALIFFACFLCAFFLGGCKNSNQAVSAEANGADGVSFDKDASYAMGINIGENMKAENIILDADELSRGLADALGGKQARLTEAERTAALTAAFKAKTEKDNAPARQAEIDFLAENSKKEGVKITSSGLQYEVLSEGAGAKPLASDIVSVNYEGTFRDGSVFDSSYTRGAPAEFPLGGVIPGWTEGLQLMGVGSKYRFCIPSKIAYGEEGMPPMMPPYSTLIFEVELLAIIDPAAAQGAAK